MIDAVPRIANGHFAFGLFTGWPCVGGGGCGCRGGGFKNRATD